MFAAPCNLIKWRRLPICKICKQCKLDIVRFLWPRSKSCIFHTPAYPNFEKNLTSSRSYFNFANGSDNEKCSAFIRKVRFDVRKLCYFNLVFIIFENLLFLNFMNLISNLKSSIFGVDFRFFNFIFDIRNWSLWYEWVFVRQTALVRAHLNFFMSDYYC